MTSSAPVPCLYPNGRSTELDKLAVDSVIQTTGTDITEPRARMLEAPAALAQLRPVHSGELHMPYERSLEMMAPPETVWEIWSDGR